MDQKWIRNVAPGFSRQRRIIHFESSGLSNPDVRRNVVAGLDLDDVTERQLLRLHVHLLPVPDAGRELWQHVLERLDNLVGLALLVVREQAGDDDHDGQDDAQVQVVVLGVFDILGLNGVGDQAEDGSGPQEKGEASKKLSDKFHPFWSCFSRGQLVWAVFGNTASNILDRTYSMKLSILVSYINYSSDYENTFQQN